MNSVVIKNKNKCVELSTKQKKMIIKALDYFGNKIADSEGYSSGEPYWDLKEMIENNFKKSKKQPIENVLELYIFAKNNMSSNKEIYAVLPDKTKVPMTQQFYIESDIYYMLLDSKDSDNKLTPSYLKMELENESSDSCWNSNEIDDCSNFGNCEVIFISGDFEDKDACMYTINDVIETETEFEFIME